MSQILRAADKPDIGRWVSDQQVALGANLLGVRDNEISAAAEDKVFKDRLWKDSRPPTESERKRYLVRLETLPPSTLETLCELPKTFRYFHFWKDHHSFWEEARIFQRWENGRSPIVGAKLLADRIAKGNFKSAQLRRIARQELGGEWPDSETVRLALEILSSELKGGNSRIDAIVNFRRRVSLQRWELVENALLQQSFAWPLLVLQSRRTGRSRYCTLPVEIKVTLGSDGSANLVDDGDGINCGDWREPVERALKAAKDLWAYKRTFWDFRIQKAVRDASVVINLKTAAAIIEPWKQYGFAFEGRSLEVYFALSILDCFLVSSSIQCTCATGILGERIPNGQGRHQQPKGADYYIESPYNIDQKIECATNAFFFDQIIIPKKSGTRKDRRHLKVNTQNRFSGYADHALGQGWRRHRYVRCPDFSYFFKRTGHKRTGHNTLTAADDEVIEKLLAMLAENYDPIFEINPSIHPLLVGDALYRLLQRATNDNSSRLKDWREDEKTGSFAFVRAVPGESNDRFWRVIWDLLGGDDEKFKKFCFSVSASENSIKLLAEQFNREPTADRPVRPPDLLVLVGYQFLSDPSKIPNGPFSRLHLSRIANLLGGYLKPVPNPAIRNQLNKTRVILVPEERRDLQEIQTESIGDNRLIDALRRLSIFRHGFTLQMAQKILGSSLPDCERLLRDLANLSNKDKPILAFAESAGEYFLLGRPNISKDDGDWADLQFDAANAIVGFLDRLDDDARFDFRTGLAPAWLHEAQWHLEESWRNRGTRSHKSGQARERLSRVGEDFGWSRVRWAAQFSNEDAHDIWLSVKDHLDSLPKGQLVHPIELVWAAKLAYKIERDRLRKDLQDLAEFRISSLTKALEACDAFDQSTEGDACRFIVHTTQSTMDMSKDPSYKDPDAVGWHVERAKRLLPVACEIVDPQWFELIGDAEDDHGAALDIYRQGFWNDRIRGVGGMWIESLVKYLGSCYKAENDRGNEVKSRMSTDISDRAFKRVSGKLENQLRSGLWQRPCAKERWRIGRNILITEFRRRNR